MRDRRKPGDRARSRSHHRDRGRGVAERTGGGWGHSREGDGQAGHERDGQVGREGDGQAGHEDDPREYWAEFSSSQAAIMFIAAAGIDITRVLSRRGTLFKQTTAGREVLAITTSRSLEQLRALASVDLTIAQTLDRAEAFAAEAGGAAAETRTCHP